MVGCINCIFPCDFETQNTVYANRFGCFIVLDQSYSRNDSLDNHSDYAPISTGNIQGNKELGCKCNYDSNWILFLHSITLDGRIRAMVVGSNNPDLYTYKWRSWKTERSPFRLGAFRNTRTIGNIRVGTFR